MTATMQERTYAADSWMVKRWDAWCMRRDWTHYSYYDYGEWSGTDWIRYPTRLNVPREPHSFCEFWRVVLVFCTLEWLLRLMVVRPFAALLNACDTGAQCIFDSIPHREQRFSFEPADDPWWLRGLDLIGNLLALPFRVPWWLLCRLGRGIAVALGTVGEWCEEHSTGLGQTFVGLLLCMLLMLVSLIVYHLATIYWDLSAIFTFIMVAMMFTVLLGALVLLTAHAINKAWLRPFRFMLAPFRLAWMLVYLLATQKRRICPPMTIVREEHVR